MSIRSTRYAGIVCSLILITSALAAGSQTSTDVVHDNALDTSPGRLLQAAISCYAAFNTTFMVNSTVQLQAPQQLNTSSALSSIRQALAEYLHVLDCNLDVTHNTSTACPASPVAFSSDSCEGGTYTCRGASQVPLDVYSAVQNSTCMPDTIASSLTCFGTALDLTTYLDLQQGQCCLQCPDEPECSLTSSSADTDAASSTDAAATQCSNFSVSIAVEDSLAGRSAQAQLIDATGTGLLDLYLHAAGLLNTTTLGIGPTGGLNATALANRWIFPMLMPAQSVSGMGHIAHDSLPDRVSCFNVPSRPEPCIMTSTLHTP